MKSYFHRICLCCIAVLGMPLAMASDSNQLQSIDFRLNAQREALLIIELASPSVVVDLQRKADGLNIELLKTDVSDDQLYLLDVKDFSTAVETIEVFRNEPSTRLLVSIEGNYHYDYRLKGKYLEVTIGEEKEQQVSTRVR
ncbi:type IV pilus biogenesis protein PilQ [Vibrio astriarenae]|nr:type IV pilus biogenesis protein PilQ [Vibrio sp. C7]